MKNFSGVRVINGRKKKGGMRREAYRAVVMLVGTGSVV